MSLPVAGASSASSHVSHEPQGVGPPAQLRTVPLRLENARTTWPRRVSNSTVVVPPPAPGS